MKDRCLKIAAIVMAVSMSFASSIPIFASEVNTSEYDTDTNMISESEMIIDDTETESIGEVFMPQDGKIELTDVTKKGTITVQLTDGKSGTSKEGIHFYCIKIADIIAGEYVLTEEYEDSGINFSEIENSDQLMQAAETLAGYPGNGDEGSTDSQGSLVFSDLEVGVYLIKADDSENYDTVSPSLIAVPTWNEEAGDMEYDLTLEPKHSPKPDETVGHKNSPQTNLDDHTMIYLGIGIVCVILAVTLIVVGRKKKKK